MSPVLTKLLTITVGAGCLALAYVMSSNQGISSALIAAGMLAIGLAGPELGARK